jgi:hypothetical protein
VVVRDDLDMLDQLAAEVEGLGRELSSRMWDLSGPALDLVDAVAARYAITAARACLGQKHRAAVADRLRASGAFAEGPADEGR